MAFSTRGQIAARHARLKRSATFVQPVTDIGKQLRDSALYVLDIYTLSDSSDGSAQALPDSEEVQETLSSLMPAPEILLTENFIKSPLFPVTLLRDVARLYDFAHVEEELLTSLELSESDKSNKSITTHIWFLEFLGCDLDTIQAAVALFRRTGGSPNLFQRAQAAQTLLDNILNGDSNNDGNAQTAPTLPISISQAALQNEQNATVERSVRQPTPGGSATGSTHRGLNEPTQPGCPEPPVNARMDTPYKFDTASEREDTRKANYVHQHFKDNRLTGSLTQSIEMTLRDYNICARQHRLSASQKTDYFVNILDGPARTFFFNNASESMSFEEMAAMMIREFNSNSRQLQVYGKLSTLRIESVIAEYELNSLSDALSKIVTIIESMTPQCPPHFRSEPHKTTCLRNAVLGQQWARTPISNIVTAQYTFNGFVTDLRESMKLEEEIKSARSEQRRPPPNCTFFQQYGRNPRHVPTLKQGRGNDKSQNPTSFSREVDSSSRSFAESRRRNECHKCRARWTPGHRCQSGTIRNHVRQRMRNGESAVHIVSDLVLGMEGELEEDPSDQGTDASQTSVKEAPSSPHVHFSTEPDEVQLFDSLTCGAENTTSEEVEQAERD